MGRVIGFLYGLICYAIFFGSFLYAIGFVGNIFVPKSIDTGITGPFGTALMTNIMLLAIFAIHHSVMARRGFKKVWTKIVPESVERSTYVLLTSAALILLYWQWRPMGEVIWDVTSPAAQMVIQALFWGGFGLVLLATFLIDHFDLFGLRQVTRLLQGKPYEAPKFTDPALYKVIRHPLYLGLVTAFWATPTMTMGHLLFAVCTTAYTLVGILLEERDLVADHGDKYVQYRKQVPMLIPFMKFGSSGVPQTAEVRED